MRATSCLSQILSPKICNELKKLSVKQKFETSDWLIKPGNFLRPEDADADPAPFEPFDSRTMHWYGPDKHYWFRADVAVPQEMDGKPLWMHVCTQIDEWDDAKNPQFLLFVDGKVTQGVDMNHRDILLDRCAKGGQKYRLELQSYTGILHTEFNLIVDLREIDPEIEGLYYDMVVPLEAFPRLEEDGKARRDLESVLNEAVNLIDLRTPYNESFYQSIAAARRYLAKALYTDLAGHEEVIASCIGHTHIDVAWWWTVAQTREKVCRSFATVLKLMDEYPDYKFMSSQPQLYYFLKQRYPELYEQIKQRVAEGRWEPEGGMWVEADCNLTSGESLVRQFLYGKRFFKEEFGVDNRILWLPDVFGYSGALPQIMAKCGIDYFMTTKLAWNQFNKMPYDTFKWRGIDGTEILTHLVTTLGVGQSENDFFTTYNGILHPDALIGGWHRYQQKDINNDILISYGYGDGGGGPTRAMLETSTRMEKGIEGLPKVRQAFARTYFDELAERVKDNRRLPTWEGELYFEYHRGTYTSMARNKRSNRKIELHMMDLELLSLLAQAKVAYPEAEIDKLWHGICDDETFDLGKGRSKALAEEQSERSLYLSHVKALCEYLVAQGVTPQFWGDIMWRFPESCAELPKETICLNWGYLPHQRENEIRDIAASGITQYACPGVCGWNRWMPLMYNSYMNIRTMCHHAHKYNAIGLLNTDWGDYGHVNDPRLTIPGILYGAAFGWNAEPVEFDELNEAVSRLYYGDTTGQFAGLMAKLQDYEVFDWRNTVNWIECDEKTRAEILSEVDFTRIDDANRAVEKAKADILAAAVNLPAGKKQIVQVLCQTADIIVLWNRIGAWLNAGCPHGPEADAMAAALEDWLQRYRAQWRQVSKESSLSVLTNLICRYADLLRGRAYGTVEAPAGR